MKSVDEDKQKLIGMLFIGGAGAFLFGIMVLFAALVFQSSLLFGFGPVLMFAGLAMGGGGLYLGHAHTRIGTTAPPRAAEEARVVARFAINGIGEMIFDNFDYDADEARFYVKLMYPNGRREELECAREVMEQAGEGMRGLVVVQGSWLCQFSALMDTNESRDAYRGI